MNDVEKLRNFSRGLQALSFLSSFLLTLFVVDQLTSSFEISLSISLLASTIPWLIAQTRKQRLRATREALWPEVIESVISALHAGRTVNEALVDLQQFGPEEMAPLFRRISNRLIAGEDLGIILAEESGVLQSPRADQFFATLIFAKNFGGNSIQGSLRNLSAFFRDDIHMVEEINTRFGWIQNSAMLAAGAPWILLILLSAQPGTVASFTTTAGRSILAGGVIATVIAYLWMARISRLPEQPTVFNFGRVGEFSLDGK